MKTSHSEQRVVPDVTVATEGPKQVRERPLPAEVEELEAALTLLCSAREKVKQDEDSSDYHRLSLQIERLCSMIARRNGSSTGGNDQAL